RIIDDDDFLDLVIFEPGVDDWLKLLVAGERVAECPLAYCRKARLRGAIRIDWGLKARIELWCDGLERPAETRANDGKHFVAVNKTIHRIERLGFEGLIVITDHLDWQSADAALGVDLLDGNVDRGLGALAPLGALAGQRHEAPDLDIAAGQGCRVGVMHRHYREHRSGGQYRAQFHETFHCFILPQVS